MKETIGLILIFAFLLIMIYSQYLEMVYKYNKRKKK